MKIINRGDIYCVDVPSNTNNPYQMCGRHYYVVMTNQKDLNCCPNVIAVPLTSNIERTYIGQRNIKFSCLDNYSKIVGGQISLFPISAFLGGRLKGKATEAEMKVVESCVKEYLSFNV